MCLFEKHSITNSKTMKTGTGLSTEELNAIRGRGVPSGILGFLQVEGCTESQTTLMSGDGNILVTMPTEHFLEKVRHFEKP